MNSETFVFFGIVGSGKGTQIKLLLEYLKEKDGKNTVWAYAGNEYRKLVEGSNYTGELIKEKLTMGHLQPDFLTNSIVMGILISSLTKDSHLIFDAYPRTVAQAEHLEEILNFYKRENVKIIYIELSKEEAMKRNLLRGREDDTKEGIEKRFDEYVTKVVPAMNYFKDKDGYTLYTINGDQSIEEVHQDIIKALNS